MKQLLQNLNDGKALVAEVPCPSVRRGMILVRTAASLVSAGTERSVVAFAEKNLLGKARSRPDLVKQVLEKARREGIIPTIQAAFNRLDQPMSLGYSSAGTVVAVGEGVSGFQVGDRVACAGANYAVHAEYAVVPQNLAALIPEKVSFEAASFCTLGSIALHGFRLAEPQVGESILVIGLGLLGLLVGQIGLASGCRVFGVDIDPRRVELARSMGITAVVRSEAEQSAPGFARGRGFDAVLICADARSNDPIELAAKLARDRAAVISVGAVGLNLPRKAYFDKELRVMVSRSYGPGRYDPAYEERGQDYPVGFVRWTEGRNLEAILDLLAAGRLDVNALISHRFAIDEAVSAYELITGKRKEPFLGVVLTYPQTEDAQPARRIDLPQAKAAPAGQPVVGVLGAGMYASGVFLPAMQRAGGATMAGIATASGLSARHAAQKFGFRYASSSEQEVLDDKDINVLVILTRHNQHARQALAALRAGKHVYCEKPLALNEAELSEIETALAQENLPLLTVGFNRRFAPLAVALREALASRTEPLVAHYRVNAGYLPLTHWLHDPAVGGGRIIGEGCHFVDFLSFLIGTPPSAVTAQALPDGGRYRQDNVLLTLTYPDGSLGTVAYLANGDKRVPKERVEVFCGGTVAVLDDFSRLEVTRDGRKSARSLAMGQDKGHQAAWSNFLACVRKGGQPPIPYEHLAGVTRATFEALRLLQGAEAG